MPARTVAQHRRLWGLRGELAEVIGEDTADEALRAACVDVCGHRSTRKLSEAGASEVIRRLSAQLRSCRGEVIARPSRPETPVISADDQQHISQLCEALGWSQSQRIGLSRRVCGQPWPQSPQDADKLIEALKAIYARTHDPDAVASRIAALLEHPDLTDWERGWVRDVHARFQRATTRKARQALLTPNRLKKLNEVEARARGQDAPVLPDVGTGASPTRLEPAADRRRSRSRRAAHPSPRASVDPCGGVGRG